jgi:Protein of unknown function (DUF3313)
MPPIHSVRSVTQTIGAKTCLARFPGAAFALAAAVALPLSACSYGNPVSIGTAALATDVPMKSAPDLSGTLPAAVVIWRAPDLANYERVASSYLIPPATVYRGRGASFGGLDARQAAADLTTDVRTAMGRRFKVVDAPGRDVLTLDLILVSIEPAATYYYTGSAIYEQVWLSSPDSVYTTAGRVTIAGKISTSETGKLLVSFVAPIIPDVPDTPGTSNPAQAVKAANGQFAADLVAAIIRQRQEDQAPAPR